MTGCGVKFLSKQCRYKYRESIEQKKMDCTDPLSISILFITVDYVVNSAKNIADWETSWWKPTHIH